MLGDMREEKKLSHITPLSPTQLFYFYLDLFLMTLVASMKVLITDFLSAPGKRAITKSKL
jgi:hypothetical protein